MAQLAAHFKALFEHDWLSGSPDIGTVPKVFTPSNEKNIELLPLDEDRVFDGRGDLVPVVSPDTTEDLVLSMIDGTMERLYIEMLSLAMEWEHLGNVEPSPLIEAVLEAARRGVEVKLLLDDNAIRHRLHGHKIFYEIAR